MALAASPVNERKRVKVYELRENDWFDRGTGFCTVQAISDEGRIWVTSEEDADASLLDIKIKKDDNYQKQQETLIVWTDPGGVDMALSFQEAEGCGIVWETINESQSQMLGYMKPIPVTSLDLPGPSLKELENIERMIREGSNTQNMRDMMTKSLLSNDYILKLTALVEDAEDLESLDDLHRLCNIMKQIILYNDNGIIEHIIQDEIIGGVVGALEYDPDFPAYKANHRQFLKENSRFKEVVQMSDPEIKKKIHHTYRLQYLKDVALARVLDDPSFSLFNSLIYFHHIDIVQHVAADSQFLQEIFEIIGSKDESPQRKKDAIVFIQQSCATAKSLQVTVRTSLYVNLVNSGLIPAITFALQHKDPSVRIAGTDILIALIDHDITMLRTTISKSANEHTTPMTDTLIDLLLVEADIGIKAQVAEAIKVLLDCNPQNSPNERPFGNSDNNITAKFGNAKMNHTNKTFVENRLQPSMKKLFQPLMSLDERHTSESTEPPASILLADSFIVEHISFHESSLFSHLLEILGFFIRQQSTQSKSFILSEGLIPRTSRLLSCHEKHLRLSESKHSIFCSKFCATLSNTSLDAIKLFRTCISAADVGDHYIRALIQSNIFTTLLSMLMSEASLPTNDPVPDTLTIAPRDNLLNSSILDTFEYICSRQIKTLVVHIVETARPYLTVLGPHISLFNQLLHVYDILMDPSIATPSRLPDMDSSFMTSEAGSPAPRHEINNAGSTRWQGLKDDVEQEAYFSTTDEDDDDDELSRDHSPRLPNGTGSPSAGPHASPVKRLVEYGDDDDEEDEASDSTLIRGMEVKSPETIPDTPPRQSRSNKDEITPSKQGTPTLRTQKGGSFFDTSSSSPSSSPTQSGAARSHERDDPDSSPLSTNSRRLPSSEADISSSTSTAPSSTPPPPMSIAEKRRREEDDDDELGKLAMGERRNSKRRNSSAASSATNLTLSAIARESSIEKHPDTDTSDEYTDSSLDLDHDNDNGQDDGDDDGDGDGEGDCEANREEKSSEPSSVVAQPQQRNSSPDLANQTRTQTLRRKKANVSLGSAISGTVPTAGTGTGSVAARKITFNLGSKESDKEKAKEKEKEKEGAK